jgi:hypothetical protein
MMPKEDRFGRMRKLTCSSHALVLLLLCCCCCCEWCKTKRTYQLPRCAVQSLQVKIGERGSSVAVDGLLRLQRSYWTAADAKHNSRKVRRQP